MPTIQQLIRNARQPIGNRKKSPALRGCPQRRGVCATRLDQKLKQTGKFLQQNNRKKNFPAVIKIHHLTLP